MVNGSLATDRGIDLRQQSGGNLDEVDAALIAGCGKTGHVADHPAAEGDEGAIAVETMAQQGGKDFVKRLQRFVLLTIGQDHGFMGQDHGFMAQPGQCGTDAVEVERRDGGITDH